MTKALVDARPALRRSRRLLGAGLFSLAAAWQPYSEALPRNEFVKQVGPELRLSDKEFRFTGANNYYPMYQSAFMVDDLLNAAADQGFKVLRLWGSLEIGNQDDSNSIRTPGKAAGVYFQYWSGSAPAYNDGPDGLQHLDYVVYRAGQLGLKLVLPLVNNWNDFGGMDQYVRWLGGQYHDQFYTDATLRQWFENWIAHLLNRTNTYSGIQYKDDPTIMTWELANEPRCQSAGVYPRSGACTTQTLTAWADEMSAFIKRIDRKHLVSVGDEGFYSIPGASDWTENGGEGVDTIALTQLKNVDVMSFHLYPDAWGKDASWGTRWIERHFKDARGLCKPAMLGEFGQRDRSTRNPAYKQWTDAVLRSRGAGSLAWILSGKQDDGSFYPDYDGYTVYCPSPVCAALKNFAATLDAGHALALRPVADDDTAITAFDTPVSLNAAANDIAYGRAVVLAGSLDLDPALPGQQLTRSVPGGTFAASADGVVLFTPEAGFSGQAEAASVISDSLGRTSNPALLSVTVKPDPLAARLLASFESGTEGWASASWQLNAGATLTSADFFSDGNQSLQVNTVDGGWFGVQYGSALDLTGKTHLAMDIETLSVGTSQNVAIQVGPSFTWCQAAWGFINANTIATVDIDLSTLDCGVPDLSQVHTIFVWFSGGGSFYLDRVRAE